MSALITNPWKMSLRTTPIGRSAKEWAWAGVEKDVGRGGVGWGPTSFPSWCIIFKWKDNSQRLLALMISSVIFQTAWSRDTFRKCFSCRSAHSHLPLSLANGINVCLSILNFICHIAAQRGKHIVLYFPCLSNWSSCFSPALCCQQNVTRLQSVSWSEVITCRRNSEGKNLTREALCCRVVGCCPESISDLSNWFKLNWHGALPGITTLLYISEPFWAVNAFRVKKECAKETQRSQQQGQLRISPGGPVKTGYENVKVMLLLQFSFGLLSAISSSVPLWQRCPQALAMRPWNGFFFFFSPAFGSVYLFIVTFMSSVQGSCWVQQHQPQPEERQSNSNPNLSLMDLVTLAKSSNLNTMGLSFITEQGSEWALVHLDRVSGGITN